MHNNRITKALAILEDLGHTDLTFLGMGFSGVVFHDGIRVFKVHIALEGTSHREKEVIGYLRMRLDDFKGRKHFFPLQRLEKHQGFWILEYPFQPSIPCNSFKMDEMLEFLQECWDMRLVVRSINYDSFVRCNGQLMLVDYEIEPFEYGLFQNMFVRAQMYVRETSASTSQLLKLRRSLINNFSQFDIDRMKPTFYSLFDCIASDICKSFDQLPPGSLEKERSTVIPRAQKPISLIIKACAQDSGIVVPCIEHIVRQLSKPRGFQEIIVAVDNCKESDFLREYCSSGTIEELLEKLQVLRSNGVIDRIECIGPKCTREVNKRWFGINSDATHTAKGVPVIPQLRAFELSNTDLILQADVDVLIGRQSYTHDFLTDMISVLEGNSKVLSVGFQIYKGVEEGFQEHFGYENGGYVPEVRLCLLSRSRLMNHAPFPNTVNEQGLELSWYRSVEARQKRTGTCSIRGGDFRTFFVHPQNYRKNPSFVLLGAMDRVEQCLLPTSQINEPELQGSYHEMCLPKRNEPVVFICILSDKSASEFPEFLASLKSQTYSDWGLIMLVPKNWTVG